MLNRVITVDFGKKCGKVKPVNSINGGPRSGGYNLPYDLSEEYTEMAIPFVRAVTSKGDYGLNQFINVHCIFPDFDKDPELEESYNFLPTDLYLSSVKNLGIDLIYRLGEGAEPYSSRLFSKAPSDPEKWASICEHIVMHYNEGWANGFKMNIKYWEIWSAADSAQGFMGDASDFYELYRITALRLRERFPKIKIGGYGQSGFYSLNRIDATEEMKNYVLFMQRFFRYVTDQQTKAPLDFFTWSCYTSNPDELAMHIKYARTYLDNAGLKKTKSFICEYNTSFKSGVPAAKRPDFPSELCASLILAQKNSADMMFYSTSALNSKENGLFSIDDFETPHKYAPYNVMTAFGKLYKLGTVAETTGDYRKEVYSLCAYNQSEAAILLVSRSYTGRVELVLKGSEYTTCSVMKIVGGGERYEGKIYKADNIAVTGGRILVPAKENEIFLITLFGKNEVQAENADQAEDAE